VNADSSIESVIAPIAERMGNCADALLDIREAALQRRHPGKCVACFFKVMGAAERRREPEVVTRLKQWIEENLEIVAEDEQQAILEHVPVNLETDHLEAYCRRVMDRFHYDRSYDSRHISLRFQFKDERAA
jgi:hypothetical protein